MISKSTIGLLLLLLAGAIAAGSMALYYRGNAIDYKAQRDKASDALKQANATIDDMQVRQRDVSALDAKYTKELADAQATIDLLHDDVATGKRRLQLNATCTKQSTGPSSMGDAATAGLTADAERDYWRLRSGITTLTNQVIYLQEYINHMCLK